MIRILRNEKGIALITTLMLLVLGFAVVVTLLKLVTGETKLARMEQGYATALDSAKGGADFLMFMVQNDLNGVPPPDDGGASFGTSANGGNCLAVKRTNVTANWTAQPSWGVCGTLANAQNPDPTVSPDITLTMPSYDVYIKIIDTWKTDANGISGAACQNGCFFYTVNVRSVSKVVSDATNTKEHADVSFVYRIDVSS